MRVRLVIADDDEEILQRVRNLLERDFEIVAAVGDGQSAVEAVGRHKPELAILDVSMPQLNGIDAARQVKKEHPEIKVVILTVNGNPAYVKQAMMAGCSGYVLKSSFGRELRTAIASVLEGRVYLTPGLQPASSAIDAGTDS